MKKILITIFCIFLTSCAKPTTVYVINLPPTPPMRVSLSFDSTFDDTWDSYYAFVMQHHDKVEADKDNKIIKYKINYVSDAISCDKYIINDDGRIYNINPINKQYEFTVLRENHRDTFNTSNHVSASVTSSVFKTNVSKTMIVSSIIFDISTRTLITSTQTKGRKTEVLTHDNKLFGRNVITIGKFDVNCVSSGKLEQILQNTLNSLQVYEQYVEPVIVNPNTIINNNISIAK